MISSSLCFCNINIIIRNNRFISKKFIKFYYKIVFKVRRNATTIPCSVTNDTLLGIIYAYIYMDTLGIFLDEKHQ